MTTAELQSSTRPWIERRASPDLPIPAFAEIGYGYRPGRSFGLSIIFHQLALVLILFLSSRLVYLRATEMTGPRVVPERLQEAIYLPVLGGGSEGAGKRGGSAGAAAEVSSSLRARGRRGFAYPGPQPMVSNPPRAIPGIQTILQPMLKNPPLFERYLPLPNLERPPAPAPPEPPKPLLKVKSGTLATRPAEKAVQAPKVMLSASGSSSIPNMMASPQAPPPQPAPAREASDLPVETRAQQQGLLVLNAVPPPPDVSPKVPLGESRSLFAVAPAEATVIADPAAGAKGGGSSSKAAGNGSAADIASGDAIADIPSGGGIGQGSGGSGTGRGARYGTGTGSGLNPSLEGAGTGRGAAAGLGTGAGAGMVPGSGKGAGSAPGGGGFPGITVRGGSYGNGSESIRPNLRPRSQTSYGMTITSTASSGGGLPDFGVFRNEKVYTVYLDMRANDEDPAPSWTLQYAPLQPAGGDSANGARSDRVAGTPTPPYAMLKEFPQLTPELAAKCAHKLIIVAAVINIAGKLERLSVRQTPDIQLEAPLTEALTNWTFQPAQIAGRPIALKVLLGIRLSR